MDEIKLSKRNDYKVIGREYAKAIEYIYDARKFSSMCTFKVDGVWFYSVLVMRGDYLEPHFGVFMKGKFVQLVSALRMNNNKKLALLIKDKELMQKDGYSDKGTNFVKVLSYVFSFMSDYLDKKEMGFVKIMGNEKKFSIYKRLVKQNIEQLPYTIIDEIDDFYENKDGSKLPAKALILKYNFA